MFAKTREQHCRRKANPKIDGKSRPNAGKAMEHATWKLYKAGNVTDYTLAHVAGAPRDQRSTATNH
eukprot:2376454-Pleurochrysis_carterae.AAC.2